MNFDYRKTTPRQIQERLELNNPKTNTKSKNLDISSLKEGQAIKGSIIDLRLNEVKLLLQAEGQTLIGHLSEEVSLAIGQDAEFIVAKDSSGQFILRHKTDDSNSLMEQTIEKALTASSLPTSERNITIVKELLNHQLPIDKNTLQALHKFAIRHPDANPSTLVSMYKNNIPINSDNIGQFDSYQQGSHQLLNVIHNISNNISIILEDGQAPLLDMTLSKTVDFSEQLLSILKANPDATRQDALPISNILSQAQTEALGNSLEPFSHTEGQLESVRDGSANLNDILDLYTEILSTYQNHKLEHENLTQDSKLAQNLHSLLSSSEYSKTIREAFHMRWTIPLKNLPKEKTVSNLYRILEEDMKLLNKLDHSSTKTIESSILKEPAKNGQDNIQFMKELNEIIQYIQLPVFLNDQDLHVDVYVMNKKKALLDKKDNFTIFIHLEMEELGPINIKLTISEKNIQAAFQIDDSQASQIIEKHLDQLTETLEKKGYTFSGHIDSSEEKVNVFDEILNQNINKETSFRYSFDIRA